MAGLDLPIGTQTGTTEELSSWAAPYVTNMLGKGQALSNMPYTAYSGPLTAGQSALQSQAFQGLANLAMPSNAQMSYTPMSFTGSSFAQPMGQQPMGGSSTPYQMPMPQQPMAQQALGGFRLPTAAEQARMDQRSRANAKPVPTMMEMAQQIATDLPILSGEDQRPAISPTGAQPISAPEGRTYVNEPFFANKEDYEAWKASGADTKVDLPSILRSAREGMARGEGFPSQAQPQAQAPFGISIDPSMFSSVNTTTFDDMGMTFDPAAKTITSTGTGQVSEGYPSQAQRQAQPMVSSVNTTMQSDIMGSGMNTVEDQARAREMGMTPLQYAQAGGLGANVDQRAVQAAQQPQAQPSATSILEQYMSPYLQGALDPQYAAAQRQADIAAQNLQSQYGKAGAYGGSRQGIAEAELQRGLLDRMAGITGKGYQTAFEQAQRQFNTEQDRQMQAAQQAQRYGLDVLREQQTGGAAQRGIESEGIAADIGQFREERDYPFKQVQFQQGLLSNLPISQRTTQYADPSTLQKFGAGASEIISILDLLSNLGKKDEG